MYSRLLCVRCVIGFWLVFKQFLNCIISVDTCSGTLSGFKQKRLELHKINRALVFLKDQLITLHLAQGERYAPHPFRYQTGGVPEQPTPCVLGVGPGLKRQIDQMMIPCKLNFFILPWLRTTGYVHICVLECRSDRNHITLTWHFISHFVL